MQPFPQSVVGRFNVRIPPIDPNSTQSTLPLGTYILGGLPAELQLKVLEFMDIRTLLRFGRTCRLARILVHDHPDFRLVTKYANDAFLGVIATRLHLYCSLGDIVQVLLSPKCHNPDCRQFAELVYLPDMIRGCINCLTYYGTHEARSLKPRERLVSRGLANIFPEYFSFVPDHVPKTLIRRGVGSPVREAYMRIIDERIEPFVPSEQLNDILRRHLHEDLPIPRPILQSFTPYHEDSIWTVLNLDDLIPSESEPEPLDRRTWMTLERDAILRPYRRPQLAASIAVPYLAHRGREEVVERGVCCLGCGDRGGVMLPGDFLEKHLPWCLQAWEVLTDKLMKTQEGVKDDEEEDECRKLLKEVMPLIDGLKEAEAVNGRSS